MGHAKHNLEETFRAIFQACGGGLVLDFTENGKMALDKSQSNAYDLILMDMRMPEMSGID